MDRAYRTVFYFGGLLSIIGTGENQFGFQTLGQDPMGKAIIDPATALMLSLTELGKKK